MDKTRNLKTYRILDANINRAMEGLRVVEEVFRMVLDDKKMAQEFKSLRSHLQRAANALPDRHLLLEARQALRDVGKDLSSQTENKRKNLKNIFKSNIKRAQEALRVLEEFSKLVKVATSHKFKQLRFKLYELEKKIMLAWQD